MQNVIRSIKNTFYFDTRSLALTRISLAILIIADISYRAFDLEAHYTDLGILPREALLKLNWQEWFVSVHLMSGNYYVQAALFILAGLFAFSLMAGYKTRFSTIASWFLMISLHNRNPLILQGGDVLLRCLLFWGIFIPWENRFSIDSIRSGTVEDHTSNIFSPGSLAFTIQIAIMYVCTALLKTGREWHHDYSAIYYVLSLDQFRILMGDFIYAHPLLMKLLTFMTYWTELFGSILFFIPYKTAFFRTIGIALFFLFQTGLLMTLRVGLFPLIAISCLFILIPSFFWEYFRNLSNFLEIGITKLHVIMDKVSLFDTREQTDTPSKYYTYMKYCLLLFFLCFVLYWNLCTATNLMKLSSKAVWLGHLLRIDQKWDMFSPRPFVDDGWFIIPGKLRDGKTIDVYRNGKAVSWDKPENAFSDYRTYRWRKYMRKLWLRAYSDNRLYYGQYLCRKWNRDHSYEKNLMTFNIYYMEEKTLANYKTAKIQKFHLWEHRCF